METKQVGHRIKKKLQTATFSSEEDIEKAVRLGILALTAQEFAKTVAMDIGSTAALCLNSFYDSCLGMYPLVATHVEKNVEYSIRFFSQVNSDSIDGAQLDFVYDSKKRTFMANLSRLSTVMGTTTKTKKETFILE